VKYLSSKRPFFNSFDVYLKQILSVLTEQSVQVRIISLSDSGVARSRSRSRFF
jgi:hypothetical protein